MSPFFQSNKGKERIEGGRADLCRLMRVGIVAKFFMEEICGANKKNIGPFKKELQEAWSDLSDSLKKEIKVEGFAGELVGDEVFKAISEFKGNSLTEIRTESKVEDKADVMRVYLYAETGKLLIDELRSENRNDAIVGFLKEKLGEIWEKFPKNAKQGNRVNLSLSQSEKVSLEFMGYLTATSGGLIEMHRALSLLVDGHLEEFPKGASLMNSYDSSKLDRRLYKGVVKLSQLGGSAMPGSQSHPGLGGMSAGGYGAGYGGY